MRKRRFRNYQTTQLDPIIRLWILRLLIPLECHRKFLSQSGYDHEEIAALFKLPGSDDDETFNAKAALVKLRADYQEQYTLADSLLWPQPLANNLDRLAALVGLNEVERQLLGFVTLLNYNRLLNDAGYWLGNHLTLLRLPHMLSIILGQPEKAIKDALSARGVLAQTALLTVDRDYDNELERKLKILSRSFADRLMSDTSSPIDWLQDMITASPAPHLALSDYQHLQQSLDFLLPYLHRAIENKRRGVNVFFYGLPGTGKTQLSRLIAGHLDCPLYEVTTENEEGHMFDGDNRLAALRAAQAFFRHSPAALILFDEIEDVFGHGASWFTGQKIAVHNRKAWINQLLEDNTVPTFWLGNSIHSVDPAFIRRFDWVIELPIPPKLQRERIIRQHGQVLTEDEIKQLAQCEALAPAVVSRAASVVSCLNDLFSSQQLSVAMHDLMNKTLIAQGHPGLHSEDHSQLPQIYDPEFINCDLDVTKIAEGILRHGSARICLYGPPGSGKTAYARWLADRLGRPLHVKRGSDLLSKWLGDTEKNIRRIFQSAKADNAVLLIDEVDSFLQSRHSGQQSWEISSVNEMLVNMESFGGVFIASTNRFDGLDNAALRRFDLKVKFDVLKPQQASDLLQRYCQYLDLPNPNAEQQNELQKLTGLTAGDFAVLARQHQFHPISDVRQLLDALAIECALKEPYKKPSIGFI